MSKKIALSEPFIFGQEYKYIKECLDTGWVSSSGRFVDLFEEKIASYTGAKYAIACSSATSALFISLKILGVKRDEEVIVPTLTFIAPVNTIKYLGAEPIFMDSDEFCNIDVNKTIEFIENETEFKNNFSYNKTTGKIIRAILPVHVFGNAVDLERLQNICYERKILILEDASESLGTFYTRGKFKGQHTGSLGHMGCISFNGNKILTSGGGGMIISNNEEFSEKASYLTNQAKDDPVNFIHNEIGYNLRLSNIQAAMGLAQMENIDKALKIKKKNNHFYKENLNSISGLKVMSSPGYANNNHWLSLLKVEEEIFGETCSSLIDRLRKKSIAVRPIWKLNHLQKPYLKNQAYNIEKARDLVSQTVCLPSSISLSTEQMESVIKVINE
ncbi:MAG: aminotransferase DegT [Gammaproteobacteria bacterium]|nr:aminotransferase DegT [Gammaproteobacteria bacterium]|tara:strand:- start:1543 stop:2703 length:1161 start_codon:yes stop_codon:yes gene_type:complete